MGHGFFFLVISKVLASLCKGAGVCRKTQKDGGKEEWIAF